MSLTGRIISMCWGSGCVEIFHIFSHSDINEWSLFKRSHCRGSKRYFENVNSGLEPGSAGMHPWLQAVGEDFTKTSGGSIGKPQRARDNSSCQELKVFNSTTSQPLKVPENLYLLVITNCFLWISLNAVWPKATTRHSIYFKVRIIYAGHLANMPSVPFCFIIPT